MNYGRDINTQWEPNQHADIPSEVADTQELLFGGGAIHPEDQCIYAA